MIKYTVGQNPDQRIFDEASNIIDSGEIICFPTETNWIMAASARSKKAIEKLYRIKQASKLHHFSLLCHSISQASNLAYISDAAFRSIRPLIPGPYTFIFEAKKEVTKYIKASKNDHEVGVHFPPSTFVQKLLQSINVPLISTNITQQMLDLDEDFEIYSQLIDDQLSHEIKLIIDPDDLQILGKTTIINFYGGEPELIRKGIGPYPF